MIIARAVLNDVIVHARESRPDECCGLLIGHGRSVVGSARAGNLAPNPRVRFLLDPQDHFNALRAARPRGLDVIGFYHSHPHSPAYPSETDLAEWTYAELVSLIVSLQTARPGVRAFSWREGVLTELTLSIDEAGEGAS